MKMSPTTLNETQNKFKRFNHWDFVILGLNSLMKNKILTELRQRIKDDIFLKNFRSLTK